MVGSRSLILVSGLVEQMHALLERTAARIVAGGCDLYAWAIGVGLLQLGLR
jgi:hypothetical protein